MIYLIGGPPRCGKTTVARRLAKAVGCPWVQTDWLESAFSAYFSPGEYEPLRLDPGPDVPRDRLNDLVYSTFYTVETIAYYRAMAERAWPGVRAIVKYALFDEEDVVIEGYHIDPALVRRFLAAADPGTAREVQTAFLVREDRADILASIRRGGHKNDWVLSKTRQEATFERIAEMIVQYGRAVWADAERAGFAVHSVDGDFDRQVARAVELLRA